MPSYVSGINNFYVIKYVSFIRYGMNSFEYNVENNCFIRFFLFMLVYVDYKIV